MIRKNFLRLLNQIKICPIRKSLVYLLLNELLHKRDRRHAGLVALAIRHADRSVRDRRFNLLILLGDGGPERFQFFLSFSFSLFLCLRSSIELSGS